MNKYISRTEDTHVSLIEFSGDEFLQLGRIFGHEQGSKDYLHMTFSKNIPYFIM
jgi:hypothetical protein